MSSEKDWFYGVIADEQRMVRWYWRRVVLVLIAAVALGVWLLTTSRSG